MRVLTRIVATIGGTPLRRARASAVAMLFIVTACASTTPATVTTAATSTPSTAPATVAVAPTRPTSTSLGEPDGASGVAAPSILPNLAYTPGATNPDVSPATAGQTICSSGWTATVRPPESYTEQVKHLEAGSGGAITYHGVTYEVHGFELSDPVISHYELDHLIPLELGGAPADPRNLWMEPYEAPKGAAPADAGSQTKDKVENAARSAVCGGRLTLGTAQQEISADWYRLGQQLGVV